MNIDKFIEQLQNDFYLYVNKNMSAYNEEIKFVEEVEYYKSKINSLMENNYNQKHTDENYKNLYTLYNVLDFIIFKNIVDLSVRRKYLLQIEKLIDIENDFN